MAVTRVVLLPSAYLPSLGGVEELTRHLGLTLTAQGIKVEIWCQQFDTLSRPSIVTLDGLTVRRFPFPLPSSRLRLLPSKAAHILSTLIAMRRAVREFQPDVLHVQCFGPNGAYATALSRLTAVPLVLTLQGETVMDNHDVFEISTTLRTALRLGFRQAAAVTACSQFTLRDSEKRFGLPAGRGRVIFNGVDLAPSRPAIDYEPPLQGRYLLSLGRVVHKKGFDLLIRAFEPIARDYGDVTLAIGGSGEEEEPLKLLAQTLGIASQVAFLGRLSRSDVAALMARATAFILPSRLEPFGIVVLEAWRAGIPVIASSRGGASEFVRDGETGFLVDPFDSASFTEIIERVLTNPQLAHGIASNGRHEVTDFTWEKLAREYLHTYDTVLIDPAHDHVT